MNFDELRAELAKNDKLKYFTLSGYGNAGGRDNNELLQIYKFEWFPCTFNNIPIELHFEIQSNKILRLDCHWYPYGKFKNFDSKDELLKSFPQLEANIEERQKFISELSAKAQKAYPPKSHIRQVRFNALSGIEWAWEESEDWKDIAREIAEIVTAVTPCVENYFGKELNNY